MEDEWRMNGGWTVGGWMDRGWILRNILDIEDTR